MGSRRNTSFSRDIAVIRREENERAAMAMLLGAEWSTARHCFVKTIRGGNETGLPWHDFEYYDRKGERLSQIPPLAKVPFPGLKRPVTSRGKSDVYKQMKEWLEP